MTGPDRGPLVTCGLAGLAGLVALGLRWGFLGTALLLGAVVGIVAVALGPTLTRRTERVQDIVVPRWVGPDAVALAAEQRRLLGALGSAEQVDAVVRPRLAAVVAARLAARGVTPGSAEAVALQGTALTAFLTAARPPALSARAFGGLLDRVEAL